MRRSEWLMGGSLSHLTGLLLKKLVEELRGLFWSMYLLMGLLGGRGLRVILGLRSRSGNSKSKSKR